MHDAKFALSLAATMRVQLLIRPIVAGIVTRTL